jgi:hypothetical protein
MGNKDFSITYFGVRMASIEGFAVFGLAQNAGALSLFSQAY